MPTVDPIQSLIDQLRSGHAPLSEIRRLLHHPGAIVRVNAIVALISHAKNDRGSLKELIAAASNAENSVCLMGTISVAHVAVSCLLRVDTEEAVEAAKALLSNWPEPDRTDLTWYLKSEGLAID